MLSRSLVVHLCDDMDFTHEQVEKLLFQYQDDSNIDIKLLHSYSGEELIQSTEPFDILLLDIEMNGIDGIEAASILRDRNNQCKILMLSCAEYRYKDAFKIQAFRFVSKPIVYNEFKNAIDDATKEIFDKTKLDVVVNNIHCDVLTKDILYFDVKGSYIEVHLANGKIGSINNSMSRLEQSLDDTIFTRVNRNLVVNLQYVDTIKNATLILQNKESFSISTRRFLSVKKAFIEFDLR